MYSYCDVLTIFLLTLSSFLSCTAPFWLQMVLERYFSTFGEGTELVLPKQSDLQEKLQRGPPADIDFYPE